MGKTGAFFTIEINGYVKRCQRRVLQVYVKNVDVCKNNFLLKMNDALNGCETFVPSSSSSKVIFVVIVNYIILTAIIVLFR